MGTDPGELGVHGLIPPVEMVDSSYRGRPFGCQPGKDEGCTGPQIRGHDGCSCEPGHPPDEGILAREFDIRAQSDQLENMHEPILENILLDHARTLGKGHEGHDLGLHIRGKARMRPGFKVHALQPAVCPGNNPVPHLLDAHAHFPQLDHNGFEFGKGTCRKGELSAGDPGRGHVGSGLYTVGHDLVGTPRKLLHALNPDDTGSVPFDPGPAGNEESGQIHDFGLPGRIFEHGLTRSQCCGHEEILGPPNGGEIKMNPRPVQPVAITGDVAPFELEPGTHLFKGLEMQIHGSGTDGASPGQGDLGLSQPAQQRTQTEDRGTHGPHQLIRGLGHERIGPDNNLITILVGGTSEKSKQLDGGGDVPQQGDFGQAHIAFAENRGDEYGQGRVLRPADGHFPEQGVTAFYDELIHGNCLEMVEIRGSESVSKGQLYTPKSVESHLLNVPFHKFPSCHLGTRTIKKDLHL